MPLLLKRTLGVLDYPKVELVIEVRLFDSLIGEVGFINVSSIAVITIIIIVDHLLTLLLMHDHRLLIELVLAKPRRSLMMVLLVLVERLLPLLLLAIIDAARHQDIANDVLVQSAPRTAAAPPPILPLTA